MPLMKCTIDGESGYKWGESGTCYVGDGAREKALEQAKAIEVSKAENIEDEKPFESIITFER